VSQLDQHFDDLRRATEPDAGRLARIRSRSTRRRLDRRVLLLVPAAAAALFFALRQEGPPVAARWTGDSAERALGPYVRAVGTGHGEVSGEAMDLTLSWTSGEVALSVEPDLGVQLSVETPEGMIRVRGTVFDVRRDALGTAVQVSRGAVEVHCGDAPLRLLGADDAIVCPPVTAVGWLRRVTVLQEQGRHSEVADGVSIGLTLAPEPALALELRLQRVAAWAALSETGDALEELDALTAEHPEAAARIDAARRQPESRLE